MITKEGWHMKNVTGQVAMRERRRLQKLVDDGKACWWRRWRTLEEIDEILP